MIRIVGRANERVRKNGKQSSRKGRQVRADALRVRRSCFCLLKLPEGGGFFSWGKIKAQAVKQGKIGGIKEAANKKKAEKGLFFGILLNFLVNFTFEDFYTC